MSADETKYQVEIEPATYFGFLGDRPCLRVTVTTTPFYNFVGSETTRKVDQDQARKLAAKMISDWESNHSVVTI